MELIAKLIKLALIECFKLGVITWQPDQGAPESFEAECEIEFNSYQVGPFDDIEHGVGYTSADWFVILCGVFVIVDAQYLDTWHSSLMEQDVDEGAMKREHEIALREGGYYACFPEKDR